MLSVGFKLSNIFSKLHFQALNMVEIASLIMLSLKNKSKIANETRGMFMDIIFQSWNNTNIRV